MESLIENVDSIFKKGTRFQDWSERLRKQGRVWQSSAILSRDLEYLNRLAAHLPFFIARFDSLAATKHLTDLQWPEFDKQQWVNRLRDLRATLARSIAQHVVLLSSLKAPERIPDYLGQFMHETGENLLDALLSKQAQDIPSLFVPYLTGTLTLFERMKPTNPKPDVWTERELQIAAAPVLDILELSGYAKLLAELHGDEELWTGVARFWDTLLQSNPGTLPWLAAVTVGGVPRFQLPHRGLVRTQWSMRVQQELNRLPRQNAIKGRGRYSIYSPEKVDHPSPLVRYCARSPFVNGLELFASLYLSKQDGAEKLNWGPGVRDLNQSLNMEEESYGEDEDDDGEGL